MNCSGRVWVQALARLHGKAEEKAGELREVVRTLRAQLSIKQKQMDLAERTIERLSADRCASEACGPHMTSKTNHGGASGLHVTHSQSVWVCDRGSMTADIARSHAHTQPHPHRYTHTHTYTHTQGETKAQTHTHTHTHTHTERERERERGGERGGHFP